MYALAITGGVFIGMCTDVTIVVLQVGVSVILRGNWFY